MSWIVDSELLIIEVESRPLLYSKHLPEYSNKISKNDAWMEITRNLSEDWETLTNKDKNRRCTDIRVKWKNLRDNFRREYQAQKKITLGQGAKKSKKYRFYNQLLFLIPHVKEAQTANYSSPINVTDQDTQNFESPHQMRKPPKPFQRHRTSKNKTSSYEDAVLKPISSELEIDGDKAFCLSLVQSLKKLDDDSKMLAKIEVLKVIHSFSNKTNIIQPQPTN